MGQQVLPEQHRRLLHLFPWSAATASPSAGTAPRTGCRPSPPAAAASCCGRRARGCRGRRRAPPAPPTPARSRPRRGGTARGRRSPRCALGEDADGSPSRSTRRQVFTARGSASNRSSGICPAHHSRRPSAPVEHLDLGQRVHRPRAEDRQQRSVERRRCGWRRRSPVRCAAPAPHRARAPASGGGTRTARPGAAAAEQHTARVADAVAARRIGVAGRRTAHAGASTASTRATTWSITSSSVYAVVSMWIGAVGHDQGRGGPARVDPVAGEQGRLGGLDVGAARPRPPGAGRGPRGRR